MIIYVETYYLFLGFVVILSADSCVKISPLRSPDGARSDVKDCADPRYQLFSYQTLFLTRAHRITAASTLHTRSAAYRLYL